jgi:hypothetical protein
MELENKSILKKDTIKPLKSIEVNPQNAWFKL